MAHHLGTMLESQHAALPSLKVLLRQLTAKNRENAIILQQSRGFPADLAVMGVDVKL